jgi:crossover junction endodeoxyribonuclease RuvC
MIYIGVDPGKNGGIAKINTDTGFVKTVTFSEESLISELEGYFMFDKSPLRCVLEKVNAMPGQGVVSMFNFGQNYGFIQGVLKAYRIPYELVTPQKWKKEFSCTSDKNTSIEVCKRLFPNVNLKATDRCRKDHDGMAEALLIAEYGRRHYNGKNL